MNARFNEVNSIVQMNLKKIKGLLFHYTMQLLETIDGFFQRTRRDLSVIARGAKEFQGISQWDEDWS
jgi:hypothetical protein